MPHDSLTVSELASEARTPVSTIKFYVREGVLPSGDPSAKHRAFYGQAHVRRLRLIRALRQVGGLGMPAIRDICKRLDGKGEGALHDVIVHVIDALGRERRVKSARREVALAREEVLGLLDTQGVRVRPNARAVADLADALVGLRHVIGPEVSATDFVPYLDAMRALAEQDFEANRHLITDAASAGIAATFGTVLWEPILLVLRRIAHEDVSARTFRTAPRRRLRRR
jgi:DNA-binding transcriptional MerR regulator